MNNSPRKYEPFDNYSGVVIYHCPVSGFFMVDGNETYNLNTARYWATTSPHRNPVTL